jgi:hypothetical protein
MRIDHLRQWIKLTGQPFGFGGVTFPSLDPPLAELLRWTPFHTMDPWYRPSPREDRGTSGLRTGLWRSTPPAAMGKVTDLQRAMMTTLRECLRLPAR